MQRGSQFLLHRSWVTQSSHADTIMQHFHILFLCLSHSFPPYMVSRTQWIICNESFIQQILALFSTCGISGSRLQFPHIFHLLKLSDKFGWCCFFFACPFFFPQHSVDCVQAGLILGYFWFQACWLVLNGWATLFDFYGMSMLMCRLVFCRSFPAHFRNLISANASNKIW